MNSFHVKDEHDVHAQMRGFLLIVAVSSAEFLIYQL